MFPQPNSHRSSHHQQQKKQLINPADLCVPKCQKETSSVSIYIFHKHFDVNKFLSNAYHLQETIPHIRDIVGLGNQNIYLIKHQHRRQQQQPQSSLLCGRDMYFRVGIHVRGTYWVSQKNKIE